MLSFTLAVSERLRDARITRVVVEVIALETPTPTNTPTATPTQIPSPTPTLPTEREEIRKEIVEVFGSHSDKALLLLSCENGSLNPLAINHNNDEVKSTDYGIFQINSFWQGIRHDGKAKQFLLDPHINIRIAWRLYQDDGYSFKLWTCGRKFGI